MANDPIAEFAKIFVENVRDWAVANADSRLENPRVKGEVWEEIRKDPKIMSIVHNIIPELVDIALFHVLFSIDEGSLPLFFKDSSGNLVDLAVKGEGEMGGWLSGEDGWVEAYSKQRFSET